MSDTHSLYLIPAGTLNELEERVSTYGREYLAKYGGENSFGVSVFWDAARLEHGMVRFDQPQWVLIHDVLGSSRNKPYDEQAQMIAELSAKTSVDYEVPSLKAAIGYVFFKAVTEARVGNDQNQYRFTYTRVQETTRGHRLIVGFGRYGLIVSSIARDSVSIGVAAMWKL